MFCITRTDDHTGEGCKAAEPCVQAEAMRGERSKVTIADVIERANGNPIPLLNLGRAKHKLYTSKEEPVSVFARKLSLLVILCCNPEVNLHCSLQMTFCTPEPERQVLFEPSEPPSIHVVTAAWDALCKSHRQGELGAHETVFRGGLSVPEL